jgi:hypothetical protein
MVNGSSQKLYQCKCPCCCCNPCVRTTQGEKSRPYWRRFPSKRIRRKDKRVTEEELRVMNDGS